MQHGKSGHLAVMFAAALLGAAAHAQAAGPAGRLFERLHQPSLPTAEAAADTTLPTLTLFDAGTTWSMNRGAAPLSVLVKATDDLSGLSHILIEAAGPGGQSLFAFGAFDYPVLSVSRRVPMNTLFAGRLLQPGAWTIVRMRLEDMAGNSRKVEGAALAALGNTAFSVVNAGSYDDMAPTLVSGQLLTAAVSLSAKAKGTSLAPFVGVKLGVADTGATGVAGIATAHAAFCLADESRCIDFLQSTPLGGAPVSATVIIGRQVASALGDQPGDYVLYEVVLIDHAGNARSLLNTAFGGTTDFGALMGNTTIKLTP